LEANSIQLAPYAGAPNKLDYMVAVVTVAEVIKGEAAVKTVRVAFQSAQAIPLPPPPAGQQGRIRPLPIRNRPGVTLQVGNEGLYFLTKSSEDGVYIVPGFSDVVAKGTPNYEKDVSQVKDVVRIVGDPMAALKDPSLPKRTQAAIVLISNYRTGRA